MGITLEAALDLKNKVLVREAEIRAVLQGIGIPMDEVTLLAMLTIVHLTFAHGTLQARELEPTYRLAEEIIEAKKKGVM